MHASYIYVSCRSDTAHDSNEKGFKWEHFTTARKLYCLHAKHVLNYRKPSSQMTSEIVPFVKTKQVVYGR